MKRILPLALCCALLVSRPSFADPIIWFETGPAGAGDLPGTANVTTGPGELAAIFGDLLSLTEVDMYLITILDFVNFSATTVDNGFSVNDPQLFLFDESGAAVYMNDDGEGLAGQSALPTPNDLLGNPFGLGPAFNGLYYLAIGWWDNEPFSALGRMFEDSIGTSGPGVGGASAVISWNGDVLERPDLPTQYEIDLTGAAFSNVPVPEPSTALLMAAGLVSLLARKRTRRNDRERPELS